VHAVMLEVIMTKNTSSRLLLGLTVTPLVVLARIFHELLSRDHEDGCATWQPQGVGSEAYLNGTSQGPTPEDARLPARRASSSERRTAISVVAASHS